MSNFGVISTISAPTLSSAKQAAIIKFETEYAAYKSKIDDVNRSRPPSQRIQAASIKQWLAPSFLSSLCLMGRIEGANSPSQAFDETVKDWFDQRLGANPKDISERVRSALSSVEFTKCSQDPQGNVTDFVINIVAALDKNNASSIITEQKACDNLVKQLIDKLDPPELCMRLKNEHAYWNGEERASISYFEERAGALAVETHNWERARELCAASQVTQTRSKRRRAPDPVNTNEGGSGESSASNDPTLPKVEKEWDSKCLNPECDGIHRLKDCPNTSDAKKQELLSKYYSDAKKKRKMAINKNSS